MMSKPTTLRSISMLLLILLFPATAPDASGACPDPLSEFPYGPCGAAVRYGADTVVMGSGAMLRLVDASNPNNMQILSTLAMPGFVQDIALYGDYCLAACREGGVAVISLQNPASPVQIGGFDTPGSANDIVLVGSTAFIADDDRGLQIADVSDPASPAVFASLDTPGNATGVFLAGNTAYVADGHSGLRIVNVANPAAPVEMGSYDSPGYAYDVFVEGATAYLADDTYGLRILDVSIPTSVTEMGAHTPLNRAMLDVTVSNGVAYIAQYHYGLGIVDVSDPGNPAALGEYDVETGIGFAENLRVYDDLVLLSFDQRGAHIVDVSDPENPSMLGVMDAPGWLYSTAIRGGYAYTAHYDGLGVVNVTNPAVPFFAAFDERDSSVWDIAIAGDHAYLAGDYDGLVAVDISIPASPAVMGTLDLPGTAFGIDVQLPYAYVADRDYENLDEGLRVIDVSDPANPVLVGTYPSIGDPWRVAVAGDRAYLGMRNTGVHVVDVSTPSSPALLGIFSGTSDLYDLDVSEDRLYVADNTEGLLVVDVSDPASPLQIGQYTTLGSPRAVIASGGIAYMGVLDAGVQVLDVSDPSNISDLGSFDTRGGVWGVTLDGDTLYASDHSTGLAILGVADCWSGCSLTCEAAATPDQGDEPLDVQFTASAVATDCIDPVAFSWDFGDGHSGSGDAPVHTYDDPGVYGWTMTASADGRTCTASGTVAVAATSGTIQGMVGIETAGGLVALDGAGLSGAIVLLDDSGGFVAEAPLSAGTYGFQDVPFGSYSLRADVTYTDHILYDAETHTPPLGCPAAGQVPKEVSSPPVSFMHAGGTSLDIVFPPPVVLIHGILECYEKWITDDPGDPDFASYWDTRARELGYISYTPNYNWKWWGDDSGWVNRADQILHQLTEDLEDLTDPGRRGTDRGNAFPIPAVMVGHNMGGLVCRALAGGPGRNDPAARSVQKIYLLGTPNSGSDLFVGGGRRNPLGVGTIVRRFNEVFPDYGGKEVYAIGGDMGWWGLRDFDGRVSLFSAFTIARLACREGDLETVCVPYAAETFFSGDGHVFPYTHAQLGSPASVDEILQGVILDGSRDMSEQEASSGGPDSPAGGITWGTTSRTAGTASGSVAARTAGKTAFPMGSVSETNGMAFFLFVQEGSGVFTLVDPSGGQTILTDSLFVLDDPEPGDWTLEVEPGGGGAVFKAAMVENSTFGAYAYFTKTRYTPGQTACIRVDSKGDMTGVSTDAVSATLYDGQGGELQTIALSPLADFYRGTFDVPGTPGEYPVKVTATGTYLGSNFSRVVHETLYAVSELDLFTGDFSDAGEDTDGNGPLDAVRVSAELSFADPGHYALWGDIEDGEGNALAHATVSSFIPSAGTYTADLIFDLSKASCSQFGEPFRVVNLEVVDGDTLAPLDAWEDPVSTASYDAQDFECSGDEPAIPQVMALYPDEAVAGTTQTVNVGGTNFNADATVTFGSGMTVLSETWFNKNLIRTTVLVTPGAAPGPRSVTVANPGGAAGTLEDAIEIRSDAMPAVTIRSPGEGENLDGKVVVGADATDDLRVEQVVFALDGQPKKTDTSFPFRWEWNTTASADGTHVLSATAADSSGQTSTDEISVRVRVPEMPGDCDGNGSISIGEVQRAVNMFLGVEDAACGVDSDGNGTVSVGEVQSVINAFLNG